MTLDSAAVETALAENRELTDGRARNAHAEQIVELAEQLGDEAKLTEALLNLIDAYQYSAEGDKMLVPFARLLRRYDAHPEYYGQYEAHHLFWTFKWVSSGMIDHPDVSLESIEDWLREMTRRYREAGQSPDAVHKCDLIIALHLGDAERTARAYQRWKDAERDELSDCYACDLVRRGYHHVHLGDDDTAVTIWRPLLEGEREGCKEQPHGVLGDALLPLLRLGRVDEARSARLRGYRLARHNESLLETVGQHIEFCALSGNEARALEILSEHRKYLDGVFDQSTAAIFQTAVAVLMRRLVITGLGGQEVPGPGGRTWTAAELLPELKTRVAETDARFDARNGTDVVSRRTRERLEREPFAPVRLGTSSPVLPAPTVTAVPGLATTETDDLDTLIAAARTSQETGETDETIVAWRLAAEAAEAQGRQLEPDVHGEILRSRHYGASLPEKLEQAHLLGEAAASFSRAGRKDKAQVCLIQEAYLMWRNGLKEAAGSQAATALAAIERLYARGDATARERFKAHAEAIRLRLIELDEAKKPITDYAETDTALARLGEDAAAHPEAESMLRVRAFLELTRGQIAERRDDTETAITRLRECIRLSREAGRANVRFPSLRLAGCLLRLERAEEAQEVIESALTVADPQSNARVNAALCGQLTELLLARSRFDETITRALEAGHWHEASGNPVAAAFDHYLAARAHLGLGQPFAAATILETVLPILESADAGVAVEVRFQLITALMRIGEFRDAAKHALTGVEAAKEQNLPFGHAQYASVAAEALRGDSKDVQAAQAYQAAAQLWRDLGEPVPMAGLIRSLAMLRTDTGDCESARTDLAGLTEELTAALARTDAQSPQLLEYELALVTQARAYNLSIHLDREEDFDVDRRRAVVDLARQASGSLEALGPPYRHDRFGIDRQLVFYLSEAGDDAAAVTQAVASEKHCREAGTEFEPRAADFAELAKHFSDR